MADRREKVRAFLDSRTTLTLACLDEEGLWAADVYYVRDGNSLCFLSSPKSRHALAFAARPAAAGTVHGDATNWREIRGVQMSGKVKEVFPGPVAHEILESYLEHYPFARGLLFGAARMLDRVRLYRFRPDRLFFVDNSGGLGERVEVDLEG